MPGILVLPILSCKTEMEQDHPAEFLTMMHESNSPQVMKPNGDLDLFRAALKLKALLTAGTITREIFLVNRRTLLGYSESTARAISNLTRNDELADAVAEALTRPHIARVFSVGGWRKLATGRLYGVSPKALFMLQGLC
jgi:hypothetical protein